MKARVSISDALRDSKLLGAALGPLKTWAMWLAVLRAAFGLRLTKSEREAFASVAGDRKPPSRRVRELWGVIGRRSGKSRMAAALAVYIALLTDGRSKLAPGEIGYVLVLAPSLLQARLIFGYAEAFIRESPLLAAQLDGEPTANEIRLRGGVVIAIHSASFRNVRGRTLLACIFDESGVWRDELSAAPDLEVYRAVLPALATTNGMLIGIGSPYGKRGLLWTRHRDYYGKDGNDVLIVKGPSSTFNPTLDLGVIAAAERDDPESAQSEWLAEFRSDLSALLDDLVIDGAVEIGRPLELPPRSAHKYYAFTDASAGRHDSFTCAIGHAEGDRFIADVIRGTPAPFDPGSVAAEYAALAKQYRCERITGDNYAGEWVAQAFRDAGIAYETADLPKSALYLESLPYWNRGAISIPDSPQLLRELRLLERRVHRSGKDSVDHGRGGSDDYANALVGCLRLAVKAQRPQIIVGWNPSMYGPCGNGNRVHIVSAKPERSLRIVHRTEADCDLVNGRWRVKA